jgi:hypothetical protein
VLIPHVNVTYAALFSLVDRVDAIYDVTIAYKYGHSQTRTTAPLVRELFLNEPIEIHAQLRRLPIEDLKALKANNGLTKEFTANWLLALFNKKDRILKSFYALNSTQPIAARNHQYRLSVRQVLPSLLFFSLSTFAILKFDLTRKLYWRIYFYGSALSIFYAKFNSIFEKI